MAIKPTDFELVPIDLIDAVITYAVWLDSRGYRVRPEPYDLEYPNTPVLLAARGHQSVFAEVSTSANVGRAEEWVKYGKSSSSDTRYIVAIANSKPIPPEDLLKLGRLGVGVDLITQDVIQQLCAPVDLSLNVSFPALNRKLSRLLGGARDLLNQGNWQEAYEDACVVLESKARDHLAKAVRSGRVTFVSQKGRPVAFTESQINKMTMGNLASTFLLIANPSQADSRVAQALGRINQNRITVAHFKHKSGSRYIKLRNQVGKNFYIIVNALEQMT